MLQSSVRPLLGEVRGLYLTSSLPRSSARCLSTVGGSGTVVTSRQPLGADNGSRGPSAVTAAVGLGVAGAVTLGMTWYLHSRERRGVSERGRRLPLPVLDLRASDGDGKGEKVVAKVSIRERRYKAFSSIKFKGEPYMTPRDFLESVTLDEPRREFGLPTVVSRGKFFRSIGAHV